MRILRLILILLLSAGSLRAETVSTSTTTLTLSAANDTYVFTGGSGATWTLPAVSGNKGKTLWVKNRGSAAITLQRGGSDQLYNTGAANSISVAAGEWCRVENDGTYWTVAIAAAGGGGGAPTDATYITQTANGSLSNEQALGALATGLLKNTTTTGVLSIAAAGTDYVVPDSELTALAGLTSAADKLPYFTGSGTAGLTDFTSAGRAILDDANAAAQRTTLGLGTIATQAASSVSITGGNIDAVVVTGSQIDGAQMSNTVLGTPTSGTLTNCTGLPIATGVSGLGSGVATFLATPSSANLASAVTNETGSGVLVFGTSPTITTSLSMAGDITFTAGSDRKLTVDRTATTDYCRTLYATGGTEQWAFGMRGDSATNNSFTLTGNSAQSFPVCLVIAPGSTYTTYWYGTDATSADVWFDSTGAAVFNEQSNAQNFRVESDGNANMLFVDGTNNRVGVGLNNPASALEVSGDVTVTTEAYDASGWNGDNTVPTKDAVRDKIEALSAGGGLGTADIDTSAEIATIVTDETGTGALVFASGPTFEGAAVFNESGAASNFRVESDVNVNMLFVDGANNRVGIGLNNPETTLHVSGDITASGALIGDGAGVTNLTADNITAGTVAAARLPAASTSAQGASELATAAETTTGTDTGRTVTPDGLSGSDYGKRIVSILIPGALATGDNATPPFRVPVEMNGWNLVGVAACARVASSSGTPTFQVRRVRSAASADMLSTALSLDANEVDSSTAATAAVINTSNDDCATADQIYIDCDTAGTGTTDSTVQLIFQLP